jgi:protein SCO1/2
MAQVPEDLQRPPWLLFIRRNIWALAFTAGALTLTAIRLTEVLMHVPDPPEVQFVLPDQYTLVDDRDRPFTPETMRGKVWVAGFVFTTCPSSCPAVTQAMKELRERFDRYQVDVEMVSFTVDPEHDTPKVLREYMASTQIDDTHWRFVTGEAEALFTLVRKGFKLGVGEREADVDGVAYDIAHSTRLALVDGSGGVRGTYPIDGDYGTDEIFERAQHVLREMERGR